MDTSTNKQTMSEEDIKLKFITPNRENKPARMRRVFVAYGRVFLLLWNQLFILLPDDK